MKYLFLILLTACSFKFEHNPYPSTVVDVSTLPECPKGIGARRPKESPKYTRFKADNGDVLFVANKSDTIPRQCLRRNIVPQKQSGSYDICDIDPDNIVCAMPEKQL